MLIDNSKKGSWSKDPNAKNEIIPHEIKRIGGNIEADLVKQEIYKVDTYHANGHAFQSKALVVPTCLYKHCVKLRQSTNELLIHQN